MIFKDHHAHLASKKKGNVDTEIVFDMMKQLYENNNLDKMVLVSGDGDYKKCVEHFIAKQRFLKILFPSKRRSSLYKNLEPQFYDYLESIKASISYDSPV